jgi:Fe-Mn family superoxide dismutase
MTPILVVDVWEHADSLDFQQDREVFLTAWFERLVNWRFVAVQFESVRSGGHVAYRYPTPLQAAA